MNQTIQNPREFLDQIMGGYRACQILLTANRVGIFSQIEKQAMTADELAATLQADQRGTRILCDALVSLSILDKVDQKYQSTEIVRQFLLPDSPESKTSMLIHAARLYERWGKLYDSVKKGRPVPDEAIDPRIKGDEEAFAKAMADVARVSAKETADQLELSEVTTLLDVGGGPGIYSIEFVKRYPNLTATVFDDEKTLQVAKKNVEREGLEDRVNFKPGDACNEELGGPYDFIFLSNFIHIYSYDMNKSVVQKCADALLPSGRVCVKDFILDNNRTSPEWCALFAVNMLVSTETGDCYTRDEVKKWIEAADLGIEEEQTVSVNSRMIIGRK